MTLKDLPWWYRDFLLLSGSLGWEKLLQPIEPHIVPRALSVISRDSWDTSRDGIQPCQGSANP